MDRIKATAQTRSTARSWPFSRLDFLLAVVVVLGAVIGMASTRLPLLITIAVVGGLALLVLVYRYMWLGLGLFVFLNLTVPQAGLNWDLGIQIAVAGETRGIHFNYQEIVITMVLLAFVLHILVDLWRMRSKGPMKGRAGDYLMDLVRNPISIGVALYFLTSILACFVGLIHGAKWYVAVFRFIRTTFFCYIFFLVLNIVKTRKSFRNFVVLMLICFTLVALFGLVQKALGESWSVEFSDKWFDKLGYPKDVNYIAGESETQAYRINSTFLHPNILGGYLVFALPFFVSLISLAWREGKRRLWLLLLVGLGINLAALFFTGSRAAWVGAGCLALIYGIFGFRDRRVWLAAATVLLVIALIIVIISPPAFIEKRFSSLSAQEAAQVRMYQYKSAMDFFYNHPFFGLGMGMEGQRLVENNLRQTWVAVENTFLTYLVSHGLIGLTAFLLVFLLYWLCLLQARLGSRDDLFIYFLSEAFFLGMVGYAVANLFGAWLLFAIPMGTLFWFYIGMGGSLYRIFKRGEAGKDITTV